MSSCHLYSQEKSDVCVLQLIIELILILVPDHHQGLWNIRNDSTSERAWPARFPCQLWGNRGGCWALRLRLEGRAETGQPSGWDLQGCRRYSHTRADDWLTAHFCLCQSGHNPALWRWHPSKVTNLTLFSCFNLKINICKKPTNKMLANRYSLCCLWILGDVPQLVRQRIKCCSKMYEVKVVCICLIFPCSWF